MSDTISFVPIQLSTLVGDVPLTFDVYIKVDDRCILYVRTGDDIETDRLKSLKKKKVRKNQNQKRILNLLTLNQKILHQFALRIPK